MGKLLTIVIPAYNAEATIGNALSSLNYKYSKYFNVLILDDGSKKPLKPFIKKWLNDYQDVITCIRKKNTNWGGCVNYAISHISTSYFKILDADDVFDSKHFKQYITNLLLCSHLHADTIINSYHLRNVKSKKNSNRYYNKRNKLLTTNFDKFNSIKLITMHALTLSVDLARKMKPLPIGTPYTDNILMFQTIMKSKTLALLPNSVNLYEYNFGNDAQSMSLQKILSNLLKLKGIYRTLLNFNINNYSNNRTLMLTNIIKSMLYLFLLIMSLDDTSYFWQKKILFKNEISLIRRKKYSKHVLKYIKIGYLSLMHKHSSRFILTLNKLIIALAPTGYLKLFRLAKKEKEA